jgi:uncharacterized membrane protein YraQ (UPF0718 family)
MNWKSEWKPLAAILGAFGVFYFLPVGSPRFDNSLLEGLSLARWYAREHVVLCLVPAFFIAGAISVFVRQEAVMKYLGSGASPWIAYPVASVSGTILSVCSCTVLPLFGGIYRRGAGLGPATAFLHSGPAINVLAIILTARVLGMEMGVARAKGAVAFSVVIGMAMHLLFREPHEAAVPPTASTVPGSGPDGRPLWQTASYFAVLVGILVFANWGAPSGTSGFFGAVYSAKWVLTGILSVMLAILLVRWLRVAWGRVLAVSLPVLPLAAAFPGHPVVPFSAGVLGLSAITSTDRGEAREWFVASWEFVKQILPLLLAGVLVSGALLGRPGHEGLIPSAWIASAIGGNSVWANLFASVVGAFMYFASLTEVPILQGLIGSGMGKGPALALLLAGPALSLPSILVIRSILGTKRTAVYVLLVVVMATVSGMIYGVWF